MVLVLLWNLWTSRAWQWMRHGSSHTPPLGAVAFAGPGEGRKRLPMASHGSETDGVHPAPCCEYQTHALLQPIEAKAVVVVEQNCGAYRH